MLVTELELKSNLKNYRVYFHAEPDFFSELGARPHTLFIVDARVMDLHGGTTLRALAGKNLIRLEIDEDRKNLDTVQELYAQVMQASPKKNMTVVSIGGGITQDLTGFMASTLYRGVQWVYVPTTLLAQADSCIGAKTSLNFKTYKNLIGTFYPPTEVRVYSGFIRTLAEIDFYSGLGEIGKLHINGGAPSVEAFRRDIPRILAGEESVLLKAVQQALQIKKSYIEEDEFDTGKRNMLNYGHCFGHAIESAVAFAIPHGQAVVLGMVLANRVARQRQLLSAERERYLLEGVLNPIWKTDAQPFQLDSPAMVEKIIAGLKQDKKRIGNDLPVVVVDDDLTMVKLTDVKEAEVAAALQSGWALAHA
ncbi:MAG: hypothetical protein HGA76_06140 [Candidatus Firestonebacteria bacterium]|nr:hypothetical protein [Candidatus Firestonebacteria bacterium]